MSNLFLFMNKYTLDHNYHRHVSHPTPNSRTENTIVGVPAVFANIICVRIATSIASKDYCVTDTR